LFVALYAIMSTTVFFAKLRIW